MKRGRIGAIEIGRRGGMATLARRSHLQNARAASPLAVMTHIDRRVPWLGVLTEGRVHTTAACFVTYTDT